MFSKTIAVGLCAVLVSLAAMSGASAATVTESNGATVTGKVTILIKKARRKPRKHRHKHKKRKHAVTLHGTAIESTAKPAAAAPAAAPVKAR